VFATPSNRYLNRTLLREYAERFGFNHPVDFDVPLRASSAEIPADRLERARAAAGFWHSHLSPLHAAVIAQSLAQDGAMLRPYVVDRVAGAGGETLYRAKPRYLGQTVSRETAALMTKAMIYTTRRGTARKSFRDPQGRPYVPEVDVSGKTGTLTGQRPYRAYTWFVGLAPAEEPEVAIAVLVVNEPKWRIKAPQMAALLLKEYFQAKR
jgi:penicillin-binding protein A